MGSMTVLADGSRNRFWAALAALTMVAMWLAAWEKRACVGYQYGALLLGITYRASGVYCVGFKPVGGGAGWQRCMSMIGCAGWVSSSLHGMPCTCWCVLDGSTLGASCILGSGDFGTLVDGAVSTLGGAASIFRGGDGATLRADYSVGNGCTAV